MASMLKKLKRKLKKISIGKKIKAYFDPEARYQVYVHYFRLNRSSGAIMIYNKKKSTINKFRLELNNDKGHTFLVDVPSLFAEEGHMIEFGKLTDEEGNVFEGKLRTIVAHVTSGNETFIAKGNKITRRK
jgi:hypothetical protein